MAASTFFRAFCNSVYPMCPTEDCLLEWGAGVHKGHKFIATGHSFLLAAFLIRKVGGFIAHPIGFLWG